MKETDFSARDLNISFMELQWDTINSCHATALDPFIFNEDVMAALKTVRRRCVKKGRSPGVDNSDDDAAAKHEDDAIDRVLSDWVMDAEVEDEIDDTFEKDLEAMIKEDEHLARECLATKVEHIGEEAASALFGCSAVDGPADDIEVESVLNSSYFDGAGANDEHSDIAAVAYE